jgi:hypothetical protein
VLAFAQQLFDFVDAALASGGSVLIHCLAGAHRAGTTGVCCLMRHYGLSPADAIAMAQSLRPVINPIKHLPEFLRRYHLAMQAYSDGPLQGTTPSRERSTGKAASRRMRKNRAAAALYLCEVVEVSVLVHWTRYYANLCAWRTPVVGSHTLAAPTSCSFADSVSTARSQSLNKSRNTSKPDKRTKSQEPLRRTAPQAGAGGRVAPSLMELD